MEYNLLFATLATLAAGALILWVGPVFFAACVVCVVVLFCIALMILTWGDR